MSSQRLARASLLLVPLALTGTWLSVHYDVGYTTSSDPSADLIARGTALSPPLVLVVLLLLGTLLVQRQGAVGAVGTIITGLSGLCLFLVGAVALPAHLEVARSVGAPESTTIVLGILTALIGLTFSGMTVALLGRPPLRFRRPRSQINRARHPARA